ncbi:MAG: efflux RND transporter periplasmic adaptor subunit [Gemmatimonadales bacterium]|jgi:RND family efflux transporter MFP subunit
MNGGKVAGLALVSLLSVTTVGCSPSSQASEADAGESFATIVNVEVISIESTDFTAYIRLTGEVEALNDVTVSAEESGVVERFFLEKGEFVRRGTPIAKIDDRVLLAQVQEAAAAAQLANERYERQRQLWEDEQIGSEIAYLEAKYQAELQAARRDFLQTRLDRTVVRAPISGIFDARYVDAGEMVAPGAQVARVVEVDQVKVTGGVPERFADVVQPGDSARISLDVLEGELVGVINFVGSTVDPRNRTFPIEVIVDNPGRVIKPKMVANMLLANRRLESAIVVPQSAIQRTEDGYEVFVVVERDGGVFAEPRPVQLGPSYANQTVVREGLSLGDRLIVRGHQLVESGDRVRIVAER